MPDLTRWVSGADFIEMGEFLADEGRRLFEMGEFVAEEAIFRAIFAVTNLQQKLHY